MDYLTDLNLSHNQLGQFQHGTFGNLGNVFTLDVSHNEIISLERFLHPLVSLRNLYIQENKITFLNGDHLLEDLPELAFISLENNDFSCDDLLELIHRFRKRNVVVSIGKSRNTTNIHGIYCSGDRGVKILSSDKTLDANSGLEEIILTKLQQLANGT
ncbi:hypothetical protein JTB14_018702 [Gonioctena quinquepunctata]|nr:hypothetical protein JTB14_018702 [Gonioctena quinquepunctata]